MDGWLEPYASSEVIFPHMVASLPLPPRGCLGFVLFFVLLGVDRRVGVMGFSLHLTLLAATRIMYYSSSEHEISSALGMFFFVFCLASACFSHSTLCIQGRVAHVDFKVV